MFIRSVSPLCLQVHPLPQPLPLSGHCPSGCPEQGLGSAAKTRYGYQTQSLFIQNHWTAVKQLYLWLSSLILKSNLSKRKVLD